MPMLSDRLRLLKSWWDEVLAARAEFTVEGAKKFSTSLGAALDCAVELESLGETLARAVQLHGDLERELFGDGDAAPLAAAENVIAFPRRPQPPHVPIGDGGAA